jgi:Protein of unknown function (DUF4038)/Domain of unknown function (DUF5060)/Putative collagen-binding domain of a collagenase
MNRACHFIDSSARAKNWLLLTALLAAPLVVHAAIRSPKMPVVPKWGRFEAAFKSSINYSNPFVEASLSIDFVSPLGETNRVPGFWDGEKIWRVRFSPDIPGRWNFTTRCSDRANSGLNKQTGSFICTAPATETVFDRHGPVCVARDHRHFEYADGAPFLWLGDAAWEGARRSDLNDWQLYAQIRAQQQFTATHWVVAPGQDAKGETAFTTNNGFTINVKFFQRLDAKVDVLNRAGLLSAIVPLQEFGQTNEVLPEAQATRFVRYVVARWSADRVAWLLAFEGDNVGKKADRWKRIGRAVFGGREHAPVIILPGETQWLLDEFRNEAWVDAFGFPTTLAGEDALQWMLTGPLSVEWRKAPPRPIINLSPLVEKSPNGDDARHLLWWNLLMTPTAGASYAALPVMNWITNATTNPNIRPQDLPQWREALFLPGAKSLAPVAEFFNSIDFWRLQPAEDALAIQPGFQSPYRHIAVAETAAHDLAAVYLPEDRKVELLMPKMPPKPTCTWINTRTGQRSSAKGSINGNTCQFFTPEPGDWLLLLKAGN